MDFTSVGAVFVPTPLTLHDIDSLEMIGARKTGITQDDLSMWVLVGRSRRAFGFFHQTPTPDSTTSLNLQLPPPPAAWTEAVSLRKIYRLLFPLSLHPQPLSQPCHLWNSSLSLYRFITLSHSLCLYHLRTTNLWVGCSNHVGPRGAAVSVSYSPGFLLPAPARTSISSAESARAAAWARKVTDKLSSGVEAK